MPRPGLVPVLGCLKCHHDVIADVATDVETIRSAGLLAPAGSQLRVGTIAKCPDCGSVLHVDQWWGPESRP